MSSPYFLRNLQSNLSNPGFRQNVTMGHVPGHKVIDKFGSNPAITTATDPEDVWDHGGLYNYTDNAGATYYVSSSAAGDTQETLFSVLTVDSNGNWNEETITQNIPGQTKTALVTPSGDPIVRIWRIQNNGVRGDNYAGEIYVYEDSTVTAGVPDDGTKVRAKIRLINGISPNQTQMALYTIPTGYVGFLYQGEFGMKFTGVPGVGKHFATLQYQSARYGKVFTAKKEMSCLNEADSNYRDERYFPDPIPARTDIKLTTEEVSDTMGVWGTMCIMLVEEELLLPEFLNDIGQVKRVV